MRTWSSIVVLKKAELNGLLPQTPHVVGPNVVRTADGEMGRGEMGRGEMAGKQQFSTPCRRRLVSPPLPELTRPQPA